MKKLPLLLALAATFSLAAAKKNNNNNNNKKAVPRQIHFVNENEESGVLLTIHDAETGKVLERQSLRAKGSVGGAESYDFTVQKNGMKYAIEAQETEGDKPLKTEFYGLHLRGQDTKGTVRIIRSRGIIGKTYNLIFVGNKEGSKGGAMVRKWMLYPEWARKNDEAQSK